MFRRYLVPRDPNPAPAPSSGKTLLAPDPGRPISSGRWTIELAGRIAGRGSQVSRLMAAVQTDMVGYSRLFGLDDSGTIVRWRDLRRRLITPAIRFHRGRLAQTAGDSMLIMFDSIIHAVKCAVTIQTELTIENKFWPQDRRMDLRMGIDFGDVVEEGANFHGDGVIIAARLQAVCPAGAVCVSRAVHDKAGDRLGLPYEALGPLALKHVARPVEAYVLWPTDV